MSQFLRVIGDISGYCRLYIKNSIAVVSIKVRVSTVVMTVVVFELSKLSAFGTSNGVSPPTMVAGSISDLNGIVQKLLGIPRAKPCRSTR